MSRNTSSGKVLDNGNDSELWFLLLFQVDVRPLSCFWFLSFSSVDGKSLRWLSPSQSVQSTPGLFTIGAQDRKSGCSRGAVLGGCHCCAGAWMRSVRISSSRTHTLPFLEGTRWSLRGLFVRSLGSVIPQHALHPLLCQGRWIISSKQFNGSLLLLGCKG